MGTDEESTDRSPGRRSKVRRLIEEYELDGLGEELERKWTADENRLSLRELADHVNRKLLGRALDASDVGTLDGEVENLYRLLTDDEASAADRTRARRRLEREGVDVDGLRDDFVTYQSVRTYLKNHRDAEYAPSESDVVDQATRTVRQLRSRLQTVTESKLKQMDANGGVDVESPGAMVTVQVVCDECGRQFPFDEFVDRGHCDCQSDAESQSA